MTIPTILYLVTEDWYFCSHRLPVARAARDAGCRVSVVTRVNRHGDQIRAEGFRLVPIKLQRRRTNPWMELISLSEIARVYRREKPDLVHQVAMKPVLYGTMAARLGSVPRVVNAIAGLGYVFTSGGYRAGLLRPVFRLALGQALSFTRGCVIVQNTDDEACLREMGVPKNRIVTIPGSGVNTDDFSPKREPEGAVVVTMVSRLLWDKGVREFVDAARIVRRHHGEVRFWLVGGPDPENPASVSEGQIAQWQQDGNIEYLGHRDNIPDIWARSHIAVLPSYREGMPKSLIEAAASGRPLVVTDVPGCREIVSDDINGLLVAPRDAQGLAAAIERLVRNKTLRLRMGEAARRRVESDFSEQKVINDTMAVYRQALGDRWPS